MYEKEDMLTSKVRKIAMKIFYSVQQKMDSETN